VLRIVLRAYSKLPEGIRPWPSATMLHPNQKSHKNESAFALPIFVYASK
jgi:hypothetical protein